MGISLSDKLQSSEKISSTVEKTSESFLYWSMNAEELFNISQTLYNEFNNTNDQRP